MPSLESLAAHQRDIVDAWWGLLPRGGWVSSHIVWSRIVNATMRELALVRDDGTETLLAFPDPLSDRIAAYREALSDPEGGWPTALEMRMNARGEAQMRVIWNDRVWFGFHPGAPLQPSSDPTAEEVPTPEMWRLELDLHPRADDRIPEWWRAIVAGDGGSASASAPRTGADAQATSSARAPMRPAATSIDEALAAPVSLPAAHRVMDGAWGWDRVYEHANTAVVEALRATDEASRSALFGDDAQARGAAIDDVARAATSSLRAALHGEWLAGTPIRLLREWNERHGTRDPQGLGEVDPTARFADEVASSYPLKQVDAQLDELLRDVVARNVRERVFGDAG